MKKLYFWISLLFFFSVIAPAWSQQWDWIETIRPGGNEYCWDVALDPQGNVLSTGRVKASSTFGSGSNTITPPWKSCCETDVFLAKYRPNGTLVWAKRDGGEFADWGRSVCSDPQSNVYITGDFCDTAFFGSIQIVGVGNDQNRNIFVAKYDSSGNCLWAKAAGSTGINNSRGYSIVADSAGNCYVAGHVSGPTNFNGITFGTANKNVPFLAKFNDAGVCIWVKTINVQYTGEANEVRIDRKGDILLAGNYRGNLYVGSTTYPGNSPSWSDVFLMKMDANGVVKWTRTAVGAYQDQPYAIITDSVDNIYMTGTFANDLTFGTTTINSLGWGSTAAAANAGIDIFIAKYDRNGIFKWVKTIGNPGTVSVDDIDITPAHRVLVTGSISGSVNMSGTALSLGGNPHTFVTAYDTLGTMKWYKLNGGGTTSSIPRGIAVDPSGNVYVGGEFTGSPLLDFDSTTVQSYNGYDGYVARLFPPLDPDVFTSDTMICRGTNVELSAVQDGSPVTYQWLLPGGTPSASASRSVNVSYSASGEYDVTLITTNSYSNDTLHFINHVTVATLPPVDLGPDSVACNNTPVILYADTGYTYLWNDGSDENSLLVNTAGTYSVRVTDNNGCSNSDTVNITYDICIGMNEEQVAVFRIWPNPASDQVFISLQNDEIRGFMLYNNIGQQVFGLKEINSSSAEIPLQGISPGIYIYQVLYNSGSRMSGKLVIE